LKKLWNISDANNLIASFCDQLQTKKRLSYSLL